MHLAAFLICLISVVCTTKQTSANLLFTGDFETGSKMQFENVEACCSHSSSMLAAPVRHGKFAHRIELKKTDSDEGGSKRVELIQRTRLPAGAIGDERWFGFSIYIPSDWIDDVPEAPDIVWQIHEETDSCKSSRSPPAALSVVGGNWNYQKRYDASACSDSAPSEIALDHSLGGVDKGRWTDFVIHVKWSHLADGSLRIWKNGTQVLNEKGPNRHNSPSNGYLRFGIQKEIWKTNPSASVVSTRVLYHDELRVGDATSRYAEVAPRKFQSLPEKPAQEGALIGTGHGSGAHREISRNSLKSRSP